MTCRNLSNADVAQALREMALFLEMDEVPFKPQAYERAADTVESLPQPIADIHARGGERALQLLPGIGKGIAGRIAGLLTTGKIADLEQLRERTPVDVLELTAVDGIGPRAVRELWHELGVRDLDDLKRAARLGRIAPLFHFGEEGEQRLLTAIAEREEATGRRPGDRPGPRASATDRGRRRRDPPILMVTVDGARVVALLEVDADGRVDLWFRNSAGDGHLLVRSINVARIDKP